MESKEAAEARVRTLLLLQLVIAINATTALLLAAVSAPATGLADYSWPVKPFDRQHPVRGSFGDPRTLFAQSPTRAGDDGDAPVERHHLAERTFGAHPKIL